MKPPQPSQSLPAGLIKTQGSTSQTSPCQQKGTALEAKLQEFCCFTSVTKRLYKEWMTKFTAVVEKLHTLEEASLSQNSPLLSNSVPELILSDHVFVCPRHDSSMYGSTQLMIS
eukprot:11782810-Ditylum_brightwellii.AAC.2